MSDELKPEVRAALLFALWHHQGGSSPVGQPIRAFLGIGQHDDLSGHDLVNAQRVHGLLSAPPHPVAKVCPLPFGRGASTSWAIDHPGLPIGTRLFLGPQDPPSGMVLVPIGALEKAERRAIVYADILERQCQAMQAAVIEESHKGAVAGMRWISNTLIGPGLYPDMSEALALSEDDPAQAWFDAKVAESEAFRAAHPAPEVPPAQPQQAPETCQQVNSGVRCGVPRKSGERLCPDCNPQPQQATRVLTDAEIHATRDTFGDRSIGLVEFARAIEAAVLAKARGAA